MPAVRGVSVYLGKSAAAKNARPAPNLMLEDDGALSRNFHQSFLKAPTEPCRFKAKVEIPELPPVDVHWTSVGDTAGVALWIRNDRIGAASILLNGVEVDDERRAIAAVLASHELPFPPDLWEKLANGPMPVNLMMFYDLYSLTDPVLATAGPALANAYFTLFGTSG